MRSLHPNFLQTLILSYMLLCGVLTARGSIHAIRPNLLASLDINQDGIADFELREGMYPFEEAVGGFPPDNCLSSGVNGFGLYGLAQNQVLAETSWRCMPPIQTLNDGFLVDPSPGVTENWQARAECVTITWSPSGMLTNGPFSTPRKAFVAVKTFSTDGVHAGWIELENSGPSPTPRVVRFASEPRANVPLAIGVVPPPGPVVKSVPIQVPPNNLIVGGTLLRETTNSTSGRITRSLKLQLAPGIRCLVSPGASPAAVVLYPAALKERTPLPSPLPSGWQWTHPADALVLLDWVQTQTGEVVSESGPLVGRTHILFGLHNDGGDIWWVEANREGQITYAGHSKEVDGQPLIGEPHNVSGSPAKRYDLNNDGLVDFVEQVQIPSLFQTRHVLVPLRGQRLLTPLRVTRHGTWVSAVESTNEMWSDQPATLLEYEETRVTFGMPYWTVSNAGILGGTNGYIGVEFQSDENTHYGWIQYNFYQLFSGVIGQFPILQPFLSLHSFGYQTSPGAPVLVGAESSIAPVISLRPEGIKLDWTHLNLRAALEWSASLEKPKWIQISADGVSTFVQPSPSGTAAGFYRLRTPVPYPEVVFP